MEPGSANAAAVVDWLPNLHGLDGRSRCQHLECKDLRTGPGPSRPGGDNDMSSAELSTDGQDAVTGSTDYTAWLWNAENVKIMHKLRHSSDGQRLITGSDDDTAKVWTHLPPGTAGLPVLLRYARTHRVRQISEEERHQFPIELNDKL